MQHCLHISGLVTDLLSVEEMTPEEIAALEERLNNQEPYEPYAVDD